MKDNFTTIYTLSMFVLLITIVCMSYLVLKSDQHNSQVNKCYDAFKTHTTTELHKLCGVLK